jgi:hypothetical protein
MTRKTFLFALGLLAFAGHTAAQGTVEGFVRSSTGSAIADVFVIARATDAARENRTGVTDRLGFFRVQLNAGAWSLQVQRIGYADTTVTFRIVEDSTTRIDLVLQDRVLELQPLTVLSLRQRATFESSAGQTTRELAQGELKLIPGLAESDVLRAIEVLPGVVSTSDFSSSYNVRGGSADQNLIALDGFPIFNPFHLGGLFSVFNADMVERAELLAGGFPAQYGGRVSSVLNVESDPGQRDQAVSGGVSLLATRIAVATDVDSAWTSQVGLNSARGRVALRRSYFDQLFRPFFDFPYHLTDVQAYAEGWTRAGNRISFTGYTGRDRLDFAGVDSFPLKLRWDWGNDVAGARWLGHVKGAVLDARVGISRFNTAIDFPDFGDTRFTSRIQQSLLRADLQKTAARSLEVKLGAELNRMTYANRAVSGGTVFREGKEGGWLSGVYLQGDWRPSSDWIVELGARADYWSSSDVFVVQPRVAAKRFLDANTAVKLAVGRYAQYLHSLRDEELPIGIDIWVLAGERAPHIISDQVQTGLELFRGSWYASVEGYYRDFNGVTTNNFADDPNTPLDDLIGGNGNSYGGDLLLRRDEGRLRGFLSVSWLKARRTFPDPTLGIEPPPTVAYPPVFDRRLDIDLVLRTMLPRAWEAGIRWNFGSGLPYTRALGGYRFVEYHVVNTFINPRGNRELNGGLEENAVLLGARNSERYPAYHRLDFSLRKPFQKSWGKLTPYLEVLNVYNRKNVLFYFYEYDREPAVRSGVSMFPLLPTVGVEIAF